MGGGSEGGWRPHNRKNDLFLLKIVQPKGETGCDPRNFSDDSTINERLNPIQQKWNTISSGR